MEKAAMTTTTYKTKYTGFYVDIVSTGKLYETWLFNEQYGIKSFMYGVYKKDFTLKDVIEMAESNIEEYIHHYKEDHMND